ncbi:hypothetical protein M8J77_005176 [Diaphorina citri]|nr:hypothetical protein M8J77_005176 [Diaphorina citri]
MTDDPDDVDPDTEVTDECAMLLQSQFKPPHGIIKLPAPPSGGDETSTVSPPPHTTQHSSPTSPLSHLRSQSVCRKKKCLLPSQPPSSSRASIVFPLLTGCTHHHYRHLSDHKPPSGERLDHYSTEAGLIFDHKCCIMIG